MLARLPTTGVAGSLEPGARTRPRHGSPAATATPPHVRTLRSVSLVTDRRAQDGASRARGRALPADPGARVRVGVPDEVPVDAAAPPAAAADPDCWAAGLQEQLAARLAGAPLPPLLPLPGGPGDGALRAQVAASAHGAGPDGAGPDGAGPGGAALLLPTSGSTGEPRLVALGAGAVAASARGGEAHFGGPAHWLLSLPLGHVAGWNVLARGAVAGAAPTALAPGRPFTAAAFTAAARRLRRRAGTGAARTALVPTQLVRLLEDDDATAALADLDAVLLGGAAAPPALLARAAAAGVRVVTTYGATETCGGCVYDGVPLPGARVRLAGDRVVLGGDVVAHGYVGRAPIAPDATGVRWVETADAGVLVDDPAAPGGRRLRVLGRLDDVVVTGGEKVAPAAVEAVLGDVAGVAEVLVVGVPDADWGAAVVAVVRPSPSGAPALEDLRAAATSALGRAAAPRALVVVDDLPRRALGKPDRRAAAALAARTRSGASSGRPGAGAAGTPAAG